MRIQIESTNYTTLVNGVPCRLWEGVTERGTPCKVFVQMIGAQEEPPAEVVALLGLLN